MKHSRLVLISLRFLALMGAVVLALPATASAETITVTHWGSAFYGAPYAVGMEMGFFKLRGVDLTGVLTSTGGGTSVRNTLASDLPFGEVALSAAIEAFQRGQPIKIVSSGVESMADLVWVAKQDAPMQSIMDIVDKKIGYTSPGAVSHLLFLLAIKTRGIDLQRVALLPLGGFGANLAAVLNGVVDAGIIAEPLFSQSQGKIKPVFWVKDVLPPKITDTVTIVTDQFAANEPDKLQAILAGRREAVRFIREHPNAAAAIVSRTYGIDVEMTAKIFREFVTLNYWSEGAIDFAAMAPIIDGLRLVDKIKGDIDWGKLVDVRFLPEDLRAGGRP